jgi:hypothetical protein
MKQEPRERGIKERKECKGGREAKKKTGNIYSLVKSVEDIFYILLTYLRS